MVVICFGVAWLTSRSGLSLALGAFLAGLIISESDYSHRALESILPYRDTLLLLNDVIFVLGSSDERSKVIRIFAPSSRRNTSS